VTVALTEDHRPSSKSEAERVKQAGGQIVNFDGAARVAHQGFEEKMREIRRAQAQGLGTIAKPPVALAVSRALGDRHFKAVTGKALLIATPSVRCVELNPSCRFVALMCDGIPDVMKNEEAIFELAYLRDAKDASANARAACGALVQEAYKRGSQDNLTVIYAQFEWDAGSTGQSGTKRPAAESATTGASTVASDGASNAAAAASKRQKTEEAVAAPAAAPLDVKLLSSGAPLGPGRFLFREQAFWQEVLPEQVTIRGLETRLGLGEDRHNFARRADVPNPGGDAPLGDDDARLLEAARVVPEARQDEKEVAVALRRAASFGQPARIRRLIASSFATTSACAGALCEAAGQGSEEVIAELLRARADPSVAEDGPGRRTPLHAACAKGQERTGEMLIIAGADASAKDAQGRTPFELAREMEFGMMVKRMEVLTGAF